MKALTYFLIIFIKLCSCAIYVDLKYMNTSPGVTVYHGYFSHICKYKMFVGQGTSIDLVTFGDDIIFQTNDDSGRLNAYVEHFKTQSNAYTAIYVSTRDDSNNEVFNVLKYEHINDKMVYVKNTPRNICNLIVRISLDINQNANIHPFVEKTENNGQEVKEVKFKAFKYYKGLKFDSKAFPKYSLGEVFDSGRRVLAGYGIYQSLIERCDIVTIITSGGITKVKINDLRGELVYEQVEENFINLWSYMGSPLLVKGMDKRKGIVAKNRVVAIQKLIGKKDLDICERYALELNNIVKAKGVLGNYDYKIFHPMPGSEPIEFVFDTTVKCMKILYSETEEKILSVEVYDNKDQFYVIVYYERNHENRIIKKNNIYKRVGLKKFVLLDYQLVPEKLQMFRDMYPIYLNVDIEENSKVIYESLVLSDNEFYFRYFYINEYESYDDTKSKYRFGTIYEINPYDEGNIPAQHFKRDIREIRENVNCTEFLIRNPYYHKPFKPSFYEVYVLIS